MRSVINPFRMQRAAWVLFLLLVGLVACHNDYANHAASESTLPDNPGATELTPIATLTLLPSLTSLPSVTPLSADPHLKPSPTASLLSQVTSTPLPGVALSLPQFWETAAIQASQEIDSPASSWQWTLVGKDDPADISLVPGQAGFTVGHRPLALTVPFSTRWEDVTLENAEKILVEGHPLAMPYDWAEIPAGRKALRVDGYLPFDVQYPLQQAWSLIAMPGFEPAAKTLEAALNRHSSQASLVHLAAVGDIMLDRALGYAIEQGNVTYPFAQVADILRSADITTGNLESSLGTMGEPTAKSYTFQAPPAAADSLAQAGFDVITLANNHAMDYGPGALLQGIDLLKGKGIYTVGAGIDDVNAHLPVVIEANGLRLAFLGYVDVPVEVSGFDTRNWTATENEPGLAWADPDRIFVDVSAARGLADIVIVLLHSGYEYVEAPSPAQMTAAKAAIDAGAGLVIGHHAHILQGVSFYNGGIIVYGLGNFAFEIDGDPSTAVLNVWLDKNGVRHLEFVPAVIQFGGQPRLAEEWEVADIRSKIYRLSDSLIGQ